MAVYDYQCKKCDIIKEVHHGMSESPEVLCDECKEAMTKKFSSPPVMLKGSGYGSSTSYIK
jgi:putative FmdB family regulatory protein